jgi:CheY-like chemotaxis protein
MRTYRSWWATLGVNRSRPGDLFDNQVTFLLSYFAKNSYDNFRHSRSWAAIPRYTLASFAMTSLRAKQPLVLCIDDAEVALRVRKLLLANAGYRVLTAPSGGEGLQLFRENPVDLVIADHFLSDKSGLEIAAEMKELKPKVPILIVSAASEPPSGLEFSDGFLSKGEGPESLLEAIAALLRRSESKD